MSSTLEHDPRVIEEHPGIPAMVRAWARRLRQGEVGQLPVAIGLIVIGLIFQIASNGTFLKPFNLVNLTFQMASGGMISVGIVLVLLLGEIDLSAGVVSGMCAAIMAVVTVRLGLPGPAGLAIGLLAGMAVGTFHGIWITRFGIPSFVVTLAGVLGWQGVQLRVLDRTGTINLQDPFIIKLATTFFSGPMAYTIAALFIAYVVFVPLLSYRRRRAAGLSVPPLTVVVFKGVAIGVLVIAAVSVLDRDRGISSGLLYLVIAVIVMDFVLNRMRFGRMVYAIGGNAEAARRAGIPVQRVRVIVFLLTSAFAAWGGILSASRGYAVNQSAGQGPVLLNAIAAAVIGGTSLFGGRGSVWAALTGTMVIQSISNGMDLLSLSSSLKLMVTAGVLLSTVTIDAVLRRSKSAAAR
jgi:D-xylose transport system permease protein